MNVVNAIKWSFFSEIAAKAIQPAVFLILARLLSPQDFGVMSAALMVIAFTQIFWEAGMGKALIQRQSDLEDAANAAFWINTALGIVISFALYHVSEPVAHLLFHDERVDAVLQVMTLQILLGATSAVQIALLQREMSFRKLFWIRFATVGLPGLLSIPLAIAGHGYWALVAGLLLGETAQVIALWRTSPWRPRLALNWPITKQMMHFGVWVGLSGLLVWFYGWADTLVVGAYLGSHEMGLYRTGNQCASLIFTAIFSPISPVLYSYLSRLYGDRIRLQAAVEQIVKILILIAVPLGIVIFFISDYLESAVFDDKWNGIGTVIGVLGLLHGVSWVVGFNGEVYRAIGKPSYDTITSLATIVGYVLGYAYSIKQGFDVFVWTRLGLGCFASFLQLVVLGWVIKTTLSSQFRYILTMAACAGIPAYCINYIFLESPINGWLKIVAGVSGSVSLCVAAACWMERKGLLMGLRTVEKR